MCICADITEWFRDLSDEARARMLTQLVDVPLLDTQGNRIGTIKDITERDGRVSLQACVEGGYPSEDAMAQPSIPHAGMSFLLRSDDKRPVVVFLRMARVSDPTIWDGSLEDGRRLHVRYQQGLFSVHLGSYDAHTLTVPHGSPYDVEMETEEMMLALSDYINFSRLDV